jgi:hypothetical protein
VDLVVIEWGKRVYLVEPELLIPFCNGVNSGDLQRLGGPRDLCYLRNQDFEKPAIGLPSVPKEFRKYLLTTAVTAAILEVGGDEKSVTIPGVKEQLSGILATINVGKRSSLEPGMVLYPVDDTIGAKVYIAKVNKANSDVLITSVFPGFKVRLAVGTRLSSHDPLNPGPK